PAVALGVVRRQSVGDADLLQEAAQGVALGLGMEPRVAVVVEQVAGRNAAKFFDPVADRSDHRFSLFTEEVHASAYGRLSGLLYTGGRLRACWRASRTWRARSTSSSNHTKSCAPSRAGGSRCPNRIQFRSV